MKGDATWRMQIYNFRRLLLEGKNVEITKKLFENYSPSNRFIQFLVIVTVTSKIWIVYFYRHTKNKIYWI